MKLVYVHKVLSENLGTILNTVIYVNKMQYAKVDI